MFASVNSWNWKPSAPSIVYCFVVVVFLLRVALLYTQPTCFVHIVRVLHLYLCARLWNDFRVFRDVCCSLWKAVRSSCNAHAVSRVNPMYRTTEMCSATEWQSYSRFEAGPLQCICHNINESHLVWCGIKNAPAGDLIRQCALWGG